MLTSPVTDEGEYYGPKYRGTGEMVADGDGDATFTTPPISGYLDTILFNNGGDSNTFDVQISRPDFANEVVYNKTGLSSGLIVRPLAPPNVKAEDGDALTTRARFFLCNERLTFAIANATEDVAFEFVYLTLPN